jgi:hypothetical protein
MSEASADARGESGMRSGIARAIDAGFVPYAVAVSGDTVYVVDEKASIHVAYDASTQFADFWSTDAGDTFVLELNGIAATASYVAWTVSAGVRYCASDGGSCRLLASTSTAGRIAAGEQAVAWLDGTGVHTCAPPPASCAPMALPASRGAGAVAVGPAGVVAWTDGGKTISLADRSGLTSTQVDFAASLVVTDSTLQNLYWEGSEGLGVISFDGGKGPELQMASPRPIQLFADNGLVYWSLVGTNGDVFYCRFDDGGCNPSRLTNGLMPPSTSRGIVADSRHILSVVSSDQTLFKPTLVVWPVP